VEARHGSGIYVRENPVPSGPRELDIGAFELTEARLLFEGEAAALAATQATADDLAELRSLVDEIARENRNPRGHENADRAFHLAIARATRNNAVFETIEHLWDLRATSPEAALLHEKARSANVKPVIEEHTAVVEALAARDPMIARAAMRTHLSAVLDSLLFATEERAVEEARRQIEAKRARYTLATR
jgi:GntR family transcriptional repressor for pyruvate dehydrogenase complex